MQMPYYGIFDFLSFKYNESRVTLMGYAYRETLKRDVERTLLRLPGVKTIDDQVDVLPISASDDNLRWQTYWAVIGTIPLALCTGSDTLWGIGTSCPLVLATGSSAIFRDRAGGRLSDSHHRQRCHISLMGVVDRDSDRRSPVEGALSGRLGQRRQ